MNLRRHIFAAIVLAASLVLSEGLLQVAARYVPFVRYQISPPWDRNRVVDAALGYRNSPYFPGHDRRGYRNDDERSHYDVVAIGDSQTYGYGAAADGSWPRQLRQLSTLSVYNAGVGGYGPCEYRLVLRDVLSLTPKVVILALYVPNDIADAYSSVYSDQRCSDLKTTDHSVIEAIHAADRVATLRELARQYGDFGPQPIAPTLMGRSALFGVLRSVRYQLETRNRLPFRELSDDSFEAAAMRPYRVSIDASPRFRTVFREPKLDALALNFDDPRIAEGLKVTLAAVEEIRAETARRSVALLVVLLHNKPTILLPAMRTHPDVAILFEELARRESDATDRISAWLSQRGVRYLDTAAAMEQAVAGGATIFHEFDDHHPNAQGYGVIAEAVWRAVAGDQLNSRQP
jgi:lysophospholipase L1-like esterase